MTHQQHAVKKGLKLIKIQNGYELWHGEGCNYLYSLTAKRWHKAVVNC